MKILHVTPFFKPSWEAGGPPRSVYELARRQVKKGHHVTVFTTDGFKKRLDVEKNKPLDVEGIETYYFRNLSLYMAGALNFTLPYYLPLVARKKIKEFDIIHIHEHRTFLAMVAHHYAHKYHLPYLLQPRGSAPKVNKNKLKEIFDKIAGNDIVYHSCKILATSKMEQEQYKNYFPLLDMDKVELLPNGIDLDTYKVLPAEGQFRKEYGIKKEEMIILYLSRLYSTKGLDILIQSISEIIEDKPFIRLVIAGPDDHYQDKLEEMISQLKIEDRVLITGPLYGKKKDEAYCDADIFVLPSQTESFGNVVVEAMASFNPVVVTRTCGVSEWLNPDNSVVINYDKLELKRALLDLVNDNDKRIKMSQNARKRVMSTFNWDKIVDELDEIYQECL
ncbi:glycosyltransferase [Methanobacterium alkalithermotolerans]|uniref:Glycosyltransferase n=1 Tax=Methanobacterium alkalithermotolerans TaxID=2731220 RepID=A0A8T8K3J7_9EURY|nr:glycosyltransferase [Methanobacterium alkalithermotolerans]QUH22557.1 glycosyltransferase [Methanobacterium alkalithermotolerans]